MLTRDLLAVANLLVKLSREKIDKLTVLLTNTDSDKRQHSCSEVHGSAWMGFVQFGRSGSNLYRCTYEIFGNAGLAASEWGRV